MERRTTAKRKSRSNKTRIQDLQEKNLLYQLVVIDREVPELWNRIDQRFSQSVATDLGSLRCRWFVGTGTHPIGK